MTGWHGWDREDLGNRGGPRGGHEWWPEEDTSDGLERETRDDPGEDTGDWRGPDGEGGKYGFKYKFINKPLIYFPGEK